MAKSGGGPRTNAGTKLRPAKYRNDEPARLLWLTDPWNTLDHANDTTLGLARAAFERGHLNYWADSRSIRLELDGSKPRRPAAAEKKQSRSRSDVSANTGSQVTADVGPLDLMLALGTGHKIQSALTAPVSGNTFDPRYPPRVETTELTAFDQIHYRTDPPVDLSYIHPLLILGQLGGIGDTIHPFGRGAGRARPEFVNPLGILTQWNEKFSAARLGPGIAPRSLISSDRTALLEFLSTQKKVVLKPLHLAQSKGIQLLEWNKPPRSKSGRTPFKRGATDSALAEATDQFTRPVLLQEYLPAIKNGELRLWFVDGELLAYVRKFPIQGDFKVDIDRGSAVRTCTLTRSQHDLAEKLGQFLGRNGARLVAVDVIADRVTDLNFTSPGLLTAMSRVLGRDLCGEVVDQLLESLRRRD